MEGDRVAEEAARVPGLLHHQESGVQVEGGGDAPAGGHDQGERAERRAQDRGGEAGAGSHGGERERAPGRERVRTRSWACGPVHLPAHHGKTLGPPRPSAPQRRSASQPLRVRALRCAPRSAGLFSGRRAPTPDTLPRSSSRPRPLGRTVHLDPGWVTDLGWQKGRPQGGREGGVLPRAPPSHAQRRTSPPCAPSRAPSPSGEREKVRAPPPPLKGAAPPRPPHPARDGSALSPQTPVGSPQRLGFSFPAPCFSPGAAPFDPDGLDGRGRGWDLSRRFCCRSYCGCKGRSRRGRLGRPCGRAWRTELRAPRAAKSASPPLCWASLRGGWRSLGVLPRTQPLRCPGGDLFFLLPARPHPPRAQLGMVPQQSQTVGSSQAAVAVSNKSAFSPKGRAFWYRLEAHGWGNDSLLLECPAWPGSWTQTAPIFTHPCLQTLAQHNPKVPFSHPGSDCLETRRGGQPRQVCSGWCPLALGGRGLKVIRRKINQLKGNFRGHCVLY